MYITITYIRLKKWWHYFPLTFNAMKITMQMYKEKGFVKMKNTGWGYLHFTISSWQNEEDLRRFAHSGAHLNAMKKSKTIAHEVGTYTYKAAALPDWKTAKDLVLTQGKIFSFS